MFAYCNNNPVVYYDVAGAFAVAIPLFAIGKILFDGCVSLMAVYAAWEIGTAIGEILETLRPDVVPVLDSTENLYTAGKRQNLPSYKKTKINVDHIMSGHSSGGNRGPNKDRFPAWMTAPMIEKAITEAYKVAEKIGPLQYSWSNGVENVKQLLQGYWNGMRIQMWYNYTQKVIETAWPK